MGSTGRLLSAAREGYSPSRRTRTRRGRHRKACRGERMLRVLALLIFCTVSLLAQGTAAQAHPGHASQVRPQSHASQVRAQSHATQSEVRASLPDEGDCALHDGRCCKSICAMCYVPMPPPHQGVLTLRLDCSALLPSRDEVARPVLLGRDPPVPRPRDF